MIDSFEKLVIERIGVKCVKKGFKEAQKQYDPVIKKLTSAYKEMTEVLEFYGQKNIKLTVVSMFGKEEMYNLDKFTEKTRTYLSSTKHKEIMESI